MQASENGPHVVSFGSMEEMEQYMKNQEESANASVKPIQRTITYGSYVISPDSMSGLLIFGYIHPWEKLLEESIDPEIEKEDPSYRSWVEEDLKEMYQRNYRFGDWFSPACLEGELGSKHIASLFPITEELFISAKQNGCMITPEEWREVIRKIEAEEMT